MSIIDAQLAAATDAADSADSREEAIEAIADELVYSCDDRVMDAIDGDGVLRARLDRLILRAVALSVDDDKTELSAVVEAMRATMAQGAMTLAAEIFEQKRNDAIEAAGYDD